jgi:ferrous iron transport protein A
MMPEPIQSCLDDIAPGEEATVRCIGGHGPVRRRLLEMGFVPGTRVRVIRFAPLGDPMEISLHGYNISLRRAEARAILVQR